MLYTVKVSFENTGKHFPDQCPESLPPTEPPSIILLLRDPSSFSESSSLCAGPETGRSSFYRKPLSPPSLSPHTSSQGPGPMCPELLGRVGCISSLSTLTTLLTGPEGAPDKLFFSFPRLGCLHQRLEISSCPKVS